MSTRAVTTGQRETSEKNAYVYRVPRCLFRKSLTCLLTGLEDFLGPCYGAEAHNGSNIGFIYTNKLRSSERAMVARKRNARVRGDIFIIVAACPRAWTRGAFKRFSFYLKKSCHSQSIIRRLKMERKEVTLSVYIAKRKYLHFRR